MRLTTRKSEPGELNRQDAKNAKEDRKRIMGKRSGKKPLTACRPERNRKTNRHDAKNAKRKRRGISNVKSSGIEEFTSKTPRTPKPEKEQLTADEHRRGREAKR
jgi:hypothetical protein